MGLISAGLTDIGQKRKTNQDSIYIGKDKNFFVVADGMGGHNGGDIASALAVKTVPETMYASLNSGRNPSESIISAISAANKAIFLKGQADPKLEGMGTTVVSLYFKGDSVYVGNVGDSRAYLINKKSIYQLTRDHSIVQEKLSLGIYTREEAANDPMKNVLSRTVGYEATTDSEVFTYKVCRNDMLFICSDGLHGKVSDEDMIYLINKHIPDPAKATQKDIDRIVQTLVDQANANGGNDNISVILVLAK